MKHIWIVKKDSSTMLYYHSYENRPFKAFIVSGLLAAMNNFSEVEIRQQGIDSIEMHDLRWVYLPDIPNNLLLIGADERKSNAKVLKSRLRVIDTLFTKKYGICPEFYNRGPIDLDQFIDFNVILDELKKEWNQASQSMDLGITLDLLAVFQTILMKIINFINTTIFGQKYLRLLIELHRHSPQLKEFYGDAINPEAFHVLQLFIPKIDLENEKIIFNTSNGENILQANPRIGLEISYLKSVFYFIIQHFSQSIQEVLSTSEEKLKWNEFLSADLMDYLLRKWSFLLDLQILKDLLRLLYLAKYEI